MYVSFRSAGHTVWKPEHTTQAIFFLAVFLVPKQSASPRQWRCITHDVGRFFSANAGGGYRTPVCVCVCLSVPCRLVRLHGDGICRATSRESGEEVVCDVQQYSLVEHTGQRVGKHDVWSVGETAGFACFCSATYLSRLHAGPIPAELGSLPALVKLGLSGNQLSGE